MVNPKIRQVLSLRYSKSAEGNIYGDVDLILP